MIYSKSLLICFALKVEARPFLPLIQFRSGLDLLFTGIGNQNARMAIQEKLEKCQPDFVLTCGFAGGLNPSLSGGTVLFEADIDSEPALLEAGAGKGRFHCSSHIISSIQAKEELWNATGADAVEMESGVIRTFCKERQIASATLRVISDSAKENLPLDFNQFMTSRQKMNYPKLIWEIFKSPGKLAELLKFQKRLQTASQNLAEVLIKTIPLFTISNKILF